MPQLMLAITSRLDFLKRALKSRLYASLSLSFWRKSKKQADELILELILAFGNINIFCWFVHSSNGIIFRTNIIRRIFALLPLCCLFSACFLHAPAIRSNWTKFLLQLIRPAAISDWAFEGRLGLFSHSKHTLGDCILACIFRES